jgi:hypothetical protein
MLSVFFHHVTADRATMQDADHAAVQDAEELGDEQLKRVWGGFIVAGPQGETDWQQRQNYAQTHPGVAVPFFGPSQS